MEPSSMSSGHWGLSAEEKDDTRTKTSAEADAQVESGVEDGVGDELESERDSRRKKARTGDLTKDEASGDVGLDSTGSLKITGSDKAECEETSADSVKDDKVPEKSKNGGLVGHSVFSSFAGMASPFASVSTNANSSAFGSSTFSVAAEESDTVDNENTNVAADADVVGEGKTLGNSDCTESTPRIFENQSAPTASLGEGAEIERVTGEEEEECVHKARLKLYILESKDHESLHSQRGPEVIFPGRRSQTSTPSENEVTQNHNENGAESGVASDNASKAWREMGIGTARINVPKALDHGIGRIIVRREGVLKLLLNELITKGMSVKELNDTSFYVSFPSTGTFLFRLKSKEQCDNMRQALAETQSRDT